MYKQHKEMPALQRSLERAILLIWVFIWIIFPEHYAWPLAAYTLAIAYRTTQLPKSKRMPIFMFVAYVGLLITLATLFTGTIRLWIPLAITQIALTLNLMIKDRL